MKVMITEIHKPYHILSRAVEGRLIFKKQEDCYRFIFLMHTTNYGSPAPNLHRKDTTKTAYSILEGEELDEMFINKKHTPFVYYLSFALVGNHYHLLVVPNTEDAISQYMHNLNTAFAKYFNLKYSRRGTLFESRYKAIPIETDSQLDIIIRYINVKNPLDVYQPGWRDATLKNPEKGWRFLFKYPFSSFPDIFGKRKSKFIDMPPDIKTQFLDRTSIYGKNEYIKFLQDPLKLKEFSPKDIFLED